MDYQNLHRVFYLGIGNSYLDHLRVNKSMSQPQPTINAMGGVEGEIKQLMVVEGEMLKSKWMLMLHSRHSYKQ